MKLFKAVTLLVASTVLLFGLSPLVAAQSQPDELIGIYGLPPPPPLPKERPIEVAPTARADGSQTFTLTAAPPPRNACIPKARLEEALRGTGCTCTCQEYARKPVSDTCDIACGGHYPCWGPMPTREAAVAAYEASIPREFTPAMRATLPPLTEESIQTLRNTQRMTQGLEWSEARICKDD